MKKGFPYLGTALTALVMAWSTPAVAQNPFSDVPTNHWAYQAVDELQKKGILEGYPDGLFRGKRMLTRYEFALAIKRLLEKLPGGSGQGERGPQGEQGPPGERGPQGEPGPPGMTPQEVQRLRELTDTFQSELRSLGTNMASVNSKLDALTKRVADIEKRLDDMLKIGGHFFVFQRSDRSRFGFLDQGGASSLAAGGGLIAGRPASTSHFANNDVAHDLILTLDGKVKTGGEFGAALTLGNYLSYRGGNLSSQSIANPFIGTAFAGNPQQVGVYYAEYRTALNGMGKGAHLTAGRYRHQLSQLSFMRPDLDPYFNHALYDDGNFVLDGVKFKTSLGSLGAQFFVGSFASVSLTGAGTFNRPLIGPSISPGTAPLVTPGYKLAGINPLGLQQQAEQVAGVTLNAPLFNLGEISGSILLFSAAGQDLRLTPAPGAAVGLPGASSFDNTVVYTGSVNFKPWGRFKFGGEFAKSVTGTDIGGAGGFDNEENNAWMAHVGWGSGPIGVKAGYKYIDPGFGAPGSWGRLGNYFNPVNIQGAFANVDYKVNDKLDLNFMGDALQGARNRSAVGNLTMGDRIYRGGAGLRYKLNNRVTILGDYEGVFYQVNGRRPVEQYVTFGTDLNLTGNTMLRLAYQIISLSNFGAGAGAAGGLTALPGAFGAGSNQTATVFTTQLGVRF